MVTAYRAGPIYLLITVLFLCCSPPPVDPPARLLNFGVVSNFDSTYNPIENNYISLQPLFRALYSTLYRLDDNLRPVPLLLDKTIKEGRRVVFFLKPGLRFSDGSEITAEDVVWSMESGITFKIFPNTIYKLIEGGEDLFHGRSRRCAGIRILDKRTFSIAFTKERDDYPFYFTGGNMSILSRKPGAMGRVFSGPFKLSREIRKADRVTVVTERNPFYIGTRSQVDRLCIHFYLRRETMDEDIHNGKLDLFLHHLHFFMPRSDTPYNYFKTPSTGGFYFLLNPTRGVFKSKAVRRFFRHFLLSLDLIKANRWGFASPATRVLPYGLPEYFLFKPLERGDPTRFAPGIPLTIQCHSLDTGIRASIYPMIQKKLAPYQVRFEYHWTDWHDVHQRMKTGDFDATTVYYMLDFPLTFSFYENLFTPGHELNLMGYEHPEALDLLERYRETTDAMSRTRILARLEEIAQEEAFFIPVIHPLALLGYKTHLKRVKINRMLDLTFEDIQFETGH